MKRTALWMTGALVVTMGTAGIAMAHGKGYGDRGAGAPMMEEMFAQIDADSDGKVTKDEIEAFRAARFAAADTDGDGKLSQDEMAAARDARRMERVQAMVTRMDTDGDGLLSAEELAAGQPQAARGPEPMFDRLDADGDGALTLEEMQQARGAFGRERGMGRFGGDRGDHHREGGHRGGHHGFPFFGKPDMSDDG
ncbi:EF-hand domain-containing protein [Maliponia aquimaris]|uniref:Transaldolase/EF-hand domain-containing protein n=1 Tax=Maliponia aquimaris TaxID=1673631 RepID=A0A238L394_9RHOB|nr:EF-hand domain-containing protein [Maliponia aquimaris]SMX49281.1 transaldolase/EF-hand domain-containing protein [Maliponia aquimaris]